MLGKTIVILDGTPAESEHLAAPLAMLTEILQESGAAIKRFTLRDVGMAHCIGCFGCWLETPGICIEADAGRELTEAFVRSDLTVLFTPVTFGGYSSALKKCVDRWLPATMPYFYKVHGEVHHPPRYARTPRLVAVGVQTRLDAAEAEIFKLLVGRNAINFHPPSFAADVMVSSDPPDLSRKLLRSLLARNDALPFGAAVASMMPGPVALQRAGDRASEALAGDRAREGAVGDRESEGVVGAKRALLIIGSPKVKSPSTSSVLGGYLMDRIRELGWLTESLTLSAALLQEKGDDQLLEAADRADLLILAFPLYIDSLPFLATRALEKISAHRRSHPGAQPQSFFALCNNGFPESSQSAPALAICRQFSRQSALTWAGCLTLGAGEALSSGDPLSEGGGKGHPPTRHVMQALDVAAKALACGQPLPGQAQKLFDKCPIPFIPFSLWCWLYVKAGGRNWRKRAATLGVATKGLSDHPYA